MKSGRWAMAWLRLVPLVWCLGPVLFIACLAGQSWLLHRRDHSRGKTRGLGLGQGSCGLGAELAGFALQPQALFQLFTCCGITTGNWRKTLEGQCRGSWRGPERGVLALMDCLTSLGSPASSICKEIDSHSIIELGLAPKYTILKAGHSGETEAPEVPDLA